MAAPYEYFAPTAVYCGPSPADIRADAMVEEVYSAFNKFLKFVNCRQTRNSEYAYGCQCYGLEAEPMWVGLYGIERCVTDEDFEAIECPEYIPGSGLWCDIDFTTIWNRHQPRMAMLQQACQRLRNKLNEEPDFYWAEPTPKKWLRIEDRYEIAVNEYEREVSRTLDEICKKCQRLIGDEIDSAYSDEAAEEWAAEQE